MGEVADELLVVDSFSTDKTQEIADALGARVIEHPFESYGQQRKFAVQQAQYDFVLVLDGDEALSPELIQSINDVKENWMADCYGINRLSRIGSRWIRHGAWYPDRKFRLFDRRKIVFGGINPHDKLIPAKGATTAFLKGDIHHFTNDNFHGRMESVNRLSSHAANAFFARGKRGSFGRLLFKPGLRFISEYIIRGGFRDGFYGFLIAKSSAQYVFQREAKLMEMSIKRKEPEELVEG